MIKFEAKVKVLSVEKKTLKTSSGNDFSFTEVAVVDTDEKRPTEMITRLGSFVEENDIKIGQIYDAIILIMSNKGRDGRIWNNFILSGVKVKPEQIPTEVEQATKKWNSEPKTTDEAFNQAQDFMDQIPF